MSEFRAFVGARALARRSTAGERRHAVAGPDLHVEFPQAECFRPVVLEVGPWEPGRPGNCPHCERWVRS